MLEKLLEGDGTSEARSSFEGSLRRSRSFPITTNLTTVFRGELAAILAIAADNKKPRLPFEAGVFFDLIWPATRASVVAGTGYICNLISL